MSRNRGLIDVKMAGFKDIERALLQLPIELARTVEMEVLREGMKPVRAAAMALAPKSPEYGLLAKSIGLNVRRIRRKGQYQNRYTARVGARTGFGKTIGTYSRGKKKGQPIRRDPVTYSHLVEYGTSHSAAKPFIRPALLQSQNEMLSRMARGYEKGMAKIIKKIRSNK